MKALPGPQAEEIQALRADSRWPGNDVVLRGRTSVQQVSLRRGDRSLGATLRGPGAAGRSLRQLLVPSGGQPGSGRNGSRVLSAERGGKGRGRRLRLRWGWSRACMPHPPGACTRDLLIRLRHEASTPCGEHGCGHRAVAGSRPSGRAVNLHALWGKRVWLWPSDHSPHNWPGAQESRVRLPHALGALSPWTWPTGW